MLVETPVFISYPQGDLYRLTQQRGLVMRLINSGKYRPTAHSVVMLATLLMMFWHAILAFGQKPEYEFYFKCRTVLGPKVQEENHWSLTNEQVFEKYAAKLKNDGIAESE